ncbi:MAG: cytochrome b/b6 domain-containing protein [Cycloclasticus sp.]
MNPNIKRILIWSGWFRLSHLCIGLSTLALLASGSLIQHSPLLAQHAANIHHYAAGLLMAGLCIRISLMFFGQPHERLSYLLPKARELRTMLGMLRFYALLGKTKLPNWYAQNPFWKPIYLAVYLLLIGLLISGVLLIEGAFLLGWPAISLHQFSSDALLVFSLLHIVAVVWHDYKAGGSDVSAMINGVRTFNIDNNETNNNRNQAVTFTPMAEFGHKQSPQKQPKKQPAI